MSPSALWLQRWALGSPRVHRGLFSAYGTASVPTRRWAGWHCGSLPLWSSSGSAQFLLKYSGKCCSSFTNSVLFPDWCLFLLCTHKQYLGNLVAQCLEVILLEVCQRNEWPYPNGLSEKMRTSFGWRLSSVSGTHKQVMCCHTLFQSAKLKQFLQLLFLILVTLCYIWGLNLVIFNVLSS